ncbi:MAG: putative glycoside hydrolase [bacterium]|nr:putative glycoside hydrolase [bacterium]
MSIRFVTKRRQDRPILRTGYGAFIVWVVLALTPLCHAELQERDILMTLGMMEHASLSELPDGWNIVQQTTFDYTVGLDTTTRTQGGSSLRFSANNAPAGSIWNLRCSIRVGRNGLKTGDRLVMRAQVKTGALVNAVVRVGIAAVRVDGSTIVADEQRIETSHAGWQQYQMTITVPEGTDRVSAGIVLNIRSAGNGAATFWVDNITVTNGEMLEVPVRTPRNIRTFTLYAVHPDIYETARRYDIIMLHPLDWIYARPLKYYNPNVELYVYCNSVSTVSTVPGWMDPLDYQYVTTQRRDWLLTDLQGNPIPETGYPLNLLVDLGKSDLQQRWASRAVQIAQRCGFDGVFIDNVTYNYLSLAGVTCREYSNDEQFRQAQTRFLQTVVPVLRQHGLKVMMNFGYVWNKHPVYETWMRMADAILGESWVRVKDNNAIYFLHPATQLQHIDGLNVPHPVRCMVQGRATAEEEQTRRYLLACALLNANQHTAFHISPLTYKQTPDYLLDYELPIGQPLESYVLIVGDPSSGGVFRRRFSNGLVLVNMHPTQSFSAPIDADYVDVNGRQYRQGIVELPAQSALILVKPNSNLQITVTPVGNLSREPGDIVQFEVRIRNATSAPMNTLTVRVPVPAPLQFMVGSASDGGVYDESTRTATWFIPSIPASQTVTRTFRARVR